MPSPNEREYGGFFRARGDEDVPQTVILVPITARFMRVLSAADFAVDFNAANPTDPQFFIHSETTPATNYGYLSHDATEFIINSNAGGTRIAGGPLGVADDVSIELGTDDDSVLRHRTATLAANTALTDVLIGTPVSAATPANSLLISNVTADGDIAFFVVSAAGANSEEYIRLDASARALIINEASVDLDFRIESNGLVNAFVIDAGNDSVNFGSAGDVAVFMTVTPGARSSAPNLGVGHAVDINTSTFTDSNTAASGTATGSNYVAIAAPTIAATNTSVTHTDTATVYINAAPIAGTNMTFTTSYALWADAGITRLDGGIRINTTSANAHISEATSGTGTVTHYIGNQTINTTSDKRVKNNITPWNGSALDWVSKAPVLKEFNYNLVGGGSQTEGYGPNARGKYLGFIAQESIDWAPWAINAGAGKSCVKCINGEPCDEHALWHVEYQHLVPPLVQAVKELRAEVDYLRSR